jgi:hypothetical protein
LASSWRELVENSAGKTGTERLSRPALSPNAGRRIDDIALLRPSLDRPGASRAYITYGILAGPATFHKNKRRNETGTTDSPTAMNGDTLAGLQSRMK